MNTQTIRKVLLGVWWMSCWPALAAASEDAPANPLQRLGLTRGFCVVLGDQECRLTRAAAQQSELVFYVQLAQPEAIAAARRAADAAGLYGTRIFVDHGTTARIGLANDLADGLVVVGDATQVTQAEVLRVLRPGGQALVGGALWTKPLPEGTDDWSHHYHAPDNNPQSRDQLARAPFLTQFIVEPRYAPAPQCSVAAGGRVFMAFGNIAWHQREEPWLNTLVALNGFNGTLLWQRPLMPGIMVDRSTLVATPDVLYLADEKSCKVLDAATGQLRDEIAPPAELAGGTFWKWMALDQGILYALIGEQERLDPDAKWRRTVHGWPWNEMSRGYNDPAQLWGFGKTLLAIDPRTKQVRWSYVGDLPIDSRALCLRNGRIYGCTFGQALFCLAADSGKVLWKKTPQQDPDVFQTVGPYRPEQGPVGGWKTAVYLKCTDKALYFVGPQVPWLTALSSEDGHVLWKHPVKDLHLVIRDDGLYVVGPANSANETKKLDPLTGEVLATYPTRRRSCTRATGSADSIFFRGHEGTGRLEVTSGTMNWISAMRPSCQVGVVVAHGQLYWLPWTCDCNLQMFGAIGCAPARDFAFAQPAQEHERLQSAAEAAAVPRFDVSPADWPTYRANNTRTGQTAAAVPATVQRLWQFAPAAQTEPTAPVAAGGLVLVGGADGVVRALDATSGQVRWTAYTGGAVRYPPTVADGLALVGSGDGWAYAFAAATGQQRWRFRAAPAERRISLYGTLLSTWPVASGVLVDRGVAYCAAGISDYDGTHVYALDAATGRIRWQNNTSGHLDAQQKRGVACQGELLLHGGRLYLAGGNTVSPGVFDAATGQCLNTVPTSMGAAAPRGRELKLVGDQVRVVGQPLYSRPEAPVFDKSTEWENPVVVTQNAKLSCVAQPSDQGRSWLLVAQNAQDGRGLWSQPLPTEPVRWAIAVDAQGRVLVTLRDGRVLCFGAP